MPRSRLAFALTTCALAAVVGQAEDKPTAKVELSDPVTRLFFQDHKAGAVQWADVREGTDKKLHLDKPAGVFEFPKLEGKQSLVQMRESGSLLCVGVRDGNDGGTGSGWVLVNTGAGYSDHGDHGHWSYKLAPTIADKRLDKEQGNPAHLYLYGGKFFVANDHKNGYTRLDPTEYVKNTAKAVGTGSPRFISGGGGHITLAVADDKVGYGSWIDREGANKGRVDVTAIATDAKREPAYSFHLPSGGIHGATANGGKVFFAPTDGIDWVDADLGLKLKTADVKVNHIDLGKEGDTPRRTGAFAEHGQHVLFVTGKAKAELAVLDAKATEPKPVFVPLASKKDTAAVTPECVTAPDGKPYALVFHDKKKDADAEDVLEIIAIDPNADGSYADAKSVKTLTVGKSAVDGHSGHHAIAFDATRRYGFFTNPGDGSICVLCLKRWEVIATFAVGGTPTAIIARGGQDHDD